MMKQHKLSAAFPRMPQDEFLKLIDDIKANGQQTPIVVFEGDVLDGWHRYQACESIGIECAKEPYLGDDPRAYVKSQNLHRRHLTESQRAVAVAEVNEWRPNGVYQVGTGAHLTNSQMAEEAQVSPRTIKNAKTAITGGLGEKVKSGEIAAKPAADLVRKDPEWAREVAEGRREMPKPKRELPTVPTPDLSAQLDAMHDKLMDMQAELIELRAASHDEQLRAQARDEIQGLREALELEQKLHNALKAQRETVEYQLNDWKNRCKSLERQLQRRERGE